MANKRIQDLEQTTDLTNDDLIPLDTTKKTFATTLKSLTEWLKGTFQTTANLEQTLSDAIDKYPSSKVLKDESSRIVSVMDTKVNKSGDTMTGNLSITKIVPSIVLQNEAMDLSQNFTDYADDSIIIEQDKNGKDGGFICFRHDKFDAKVVDLCVSNGVDQNRKRQSIRIWINKTGKYGTYAPKCNYDNSIVTTVSHGSNYVRFGNGLQICWGVGGTGTVTLPVPFVNTNYQVTTSQVGGGHTYNCGTDNYTTTSFNITSYQAHWIAIGYWY